MRLPLLLKEIPSNLKASIGLLFLIVLLGTIGFHFLEGASLFNSLYWTVVTIATVDMGMWCQALWKGRYLA